MPVRAIAYHPSAAEEKLGSYSQDMAGGRGIRCAKCRLTFTVVFSLRGDLGNNDYRQRLRELIEEDCRKGKHRGEYFIEVVD
jgi:hypothetical protein